MIASTLGINLCGLDYITPDISRPEGTFLEVNTTPGLAVLVTAGHEAVDFGAQLLGERTGRVPLRMVVVAASEMPAALQWLQDRRWAPGFAWVCGTDAAVDEVRLDRKRGPREQVEAVLLNACVEQVFVVCSAESLVSGGMLVDRAEQVAVCVGLPAAWLQVLRDRSGSVVTLRDWAACAEKGWGCVPAPGGYDYP